MYIYTNSNSGISHLQKFFMKEISTSMMTFHTQHGIHIALFNRNYPLNINFHLYTIFMDNTMYMCIYHMMLFYMYIFPFIVTYGSFLSLSYARLTIMDLFKKWWKVLNRPYVLKIRKMITWTRWVGVANALIDSTYFLYFHRMYIQYVIWQWHSSITRLGKHVVLMWMYVQYMWW